MLNRCHVPSDKAYADYGGRGIYVCKRWRESFLAFLADMGERPDGLMLDRIDNNGPYAPNNCRWTTPVESSNNRRSSRLVTMGSRTMSLAMWCREFNVSQQIVRNRVKSGWDEIKAITTPKMK
jgi:hypothetical protein